MIEIRFPTERAPVTKRGILEKIASVYDPLGVVSPMTLTGKLLYRVACDLKIAWDTQLPSELVNKWLKWESQLAASVSTARALPKYREEVSGIDLHCFGDASGRGVYLSLLEIV